MGLVTTALLLPELWNAVRTNGKLKLVTLANFVQLLMAFANLSETGHHAFTRAREEAEVALILAELSTTRYLAGQHWSRVSSCVIRLDDELSI